MTTAHSDEKSYTSYLMLALAFLNFFVFYLTFSKLQTALEITECIPYSRDHNIKALLGLDRVQMCDNHALRVLFGSGSVFATKTCRFNSLKAGSDSILHICSRASMLWKHFNWLHVSKGKWENRKKRRRQRWQLIELAPRYASAWLSVWNRGLVGGSRPDMPWSLVYSDSIWSTR
ncbi:hypothetical protein VTN02DRAFT_5555 [Thermoascus thermophilus]